MSEPLFKPVSDGEVVALPRADEAQHKFGDPSYQPAPDGRADILPRQTERVCMICRIVKVTVHGSNGLHWREWRLPGSAKQIVRLQAPRCEVIRRDALPDPRMLSRASRCVAHVRALVPVVRLVHR